MTICKYVYRCEGVCCEHDVNLIFPSTSSSVYIHHYNNIQFNAKK